MVATLALMFRTNFSLLKSPLKLVGCHEEWIRCCLLFACSTIKKEHYFCNHFLLAIHVHSFFGNLFEDFGSDLKVLNSILAFPLPDHVVWWICTPWYVHINVKKHQRTYLLQCVKWVSPPQTDVSLRCNIWLVVYHVSSLQQFWMY